MYTYTYAYSTYVYIRIRFYIIYVSSHTAAKEPKPEKAVLGPSGTVTSAVTSAVEEGIEAYERAINSLKEVSVVYTCV